MKKYFVFFSAAGLVFSLLTFQSLTFAQSIVLEPHSVSSFGLGEQSAAYLSDDDALVYNPAKLSLAKGAKVSFFRNPDIVFGFGFPISNLFASYKIDAASAIGFSYENHDFGEIQLSTAENPVGTGETIDAYDRSFSVGYSRDFCPGFSAGFQFRYLYQNFTDETIDYFLFSAGLLYRYEDIFNVGFSLMNLGPAGSYNNRDVSPPAQLNLAVDFTAAENEYFRLPIDIGMSKRLEESEEGEGYSSFKALFTDWQDFPEDAAMHYGFGFVWKDLNIGNNFSFFQELFAGNISGGSKALRGNRYTMGTKVGLAYKGIKFSAGYAGVVHNIYNLASFMQEFPVETFQFSLQLENGFTSPLVENNDPLLDKIILSFGTGLTTKVGIGESLYGYGTSENTMSFAADAAFYFNRNNALISSLYYNELIYKLNYLSYDFKLTTFAFLTSYRYHPLEIFHPLFVQAGGGVYRLNPVLENTYPRYDYKIILQASLGAALDFLEPIIIMPQIDYGLVFQRSAGETPPRMQGFNHFNFMIKLGYAVL